MAVICLARQYGAGGKSVGEMVAARLGYRMVDHAVLDEVARQADIEVKWVEEVDHNAGDTLVRLANKIIDGEDFVHHLPGTRTKFNERIYRKFLTIAITKLAEEEDNLIILGRGSQLILKDNPKIIRVLLVGELEDRIVNLEKKFKIHRDKAYSIADIDEKHRVKFQHDFKEGDPNDPHLFHLTINTSLVSFEKAAENICCLVE